MPEDIAWPNFNCTLSYLTEEVKSEGKVNSNYYRYSYAEHAKKSDS